MEPKKKIRILLLTLTIVFSLIGCGSSTAPVLNENVTEKDGDEIADMFDDGTSTNEITEKMQDEIETVESTEVKAEDTEITETKPADEPTTTPAVPTSTPTPTPTATPTPTPEPHVHQYTETIIKTPTCAESGEKQLVCQGCGDVKVEAIPATGQHNWVENTTVIHHEALGHVESVIVGETAKRTEYECSYCGFRSDTAAGVADHQAVQFEDGIAHAGARTIAYDYPGEPIYENQWVVDQEAHDEVVGTGTYTCSECGATK